MRDIHNIPSLKLKLAAENGWLEYPEFLVFNFLFPGVSGSVSCPPLGKNKEQFGAPKSSVFRRWVDGEETSHLDNIITCISIGNCP